MHNKAVYRLAYSYLFNKLDAEDIVQKSFYKLYGNRKILNETDENIKKWLFKVCSNASKDLLKSHWKKREYEIEEEQLQNAHSNKKDSNVIDCLKTINKDFRIPLFLYYYEGYKISEIAHILKKSEATIKFRLSKGKELLKSELEDI